MEEEKSNTHLKYDYDLLSVKQLHEETGISEKSLRAIFCRYSKELAVQKYTKPWLVARIKWNEFISSERNEL